MRWKHRLLLPITLGSLAGSFIQIEPSKALPAPQTGQQAIEASLDVPDRIETILTDACKNCHSNESRLAWYERVAPVSWILGSEIARARGALNLSEWPLPTAEAIGHLTSACAEVESKRMPPAAYSSVRPAARLRREDVEAFCDWTGAQSLALRKQALERRDGQAAALAR